MKKTIKLGIVAFTLLTMVSCSVSGPFLITDNESDKKGTASFSVYFGIFRPMDVDVSIAKAARNGDITRVSSVDYKVQRKFIIKKIYTTTVTGN